MEELTTILDLLPGGVTTGVLTGLFFLRLVIKLMSAMIAASPSKKDDTWWAGIQSSTPYVYVQVLFDLGLGLTLPGKK